VAYCSQCGKKGQEGTLTREETFIHKKMLVSELFDLVRKTIGNSEKFTSFIHCGFGSPYDSLLLLLTPKQDKAVQDNLCNECLKKVLSTQGRVQCHDYLFSNLKRHFIVNGR
jgi:hypothetical protein